MVNLRLKRIRTVDNRTIRAQFTESLSDIIGVGNINITPLLESTPVPTVLKVNVRDDMLDIVTQPLTPFAAYEVEFRSTSTIKFNQSITLIYLKMEKQILYKFVD
jgi:hypothetical protein